MMNGEEPPEGNIRERSRFDRAGRDESESGGPLRCKQGGDDPEHGEQWRHEILSTANADPWIAAAIPLVEAAARDAMESASQNAG